MKICPVCGKEVEDDAAACPRCGHAFAAVTPRKQEADTGKADAAKEKTPLHKAPIRTLGIGIVAAAASFAAAIMANWVGVYISDMFFFLAFGVLDLMAFVWGLFGAIASGINFKKPEMYVDKALRGKNIAALALSLAALIAFIVQTIVLLSSAAAAS